MANGFFGRLARQWWLMLALGIVIGFAAGLPLGGRSLPEKLSVGKPAGENNLAVGLTVNGYVIGPGAYLYGAKLSFADLSGTDLSGANLARADLTGADLTGAKLTIANLWEADLTRADLTWADLTWANLARADLTGAKFFHTKMPDGTIRNQ